MFVFLFCVVAVAITSGSIMVSSASLAGVPVIYVILGTLFLSYAYLFISRQGVLSFGKPEKALLIFEGWGLLYVILSFMGVLRWPQAGLSYDASFLPRQAFYLFVLPAVLLFREDMYMKKVEWLLKKYGEVLFWVLYGAQILYTNAFFISAITQVFLCWLSLRIETNQKWRRWIRIPALLLIPMFEAGQSTILIIRLIFVAICIVPRYWSRIVYYLMAIAILIVIIGCFFLPFVVEDTAFSDFNMAWRMRTWKDSVTVLENTNYLGAGYGTGYQSDEYVQKTIERGEWQYRAKDGYSDWERKFVTAPHNSYIAVAMRTGVIGVSLFLLFLATLFRNLVKYRALPSKASCFALFAGATMIMFNVGLESPGYLLLFVFCIGVCIRECRKLKEQNRCLAEE